MGQYNIFINIDIQCKDYYITYHVITYHHVFSAHGAFSVSSSSLCSVYNFERSFPPTFLWISSRFGRQYSFRLSL